MADFKFKVLSFSILSLLSSAVFANTDTDTTTPTVLPILNVDAESDQHKYAATKASAVLRSDQPLFETAQSISVITEKQLQQKQAKTLSEAIEGVAGVTSGQYGRRGWDDFIIRGQVASSQTYIDGLRVQTSDNALRSEDISGLQSIEVVKGPTSTGFGFALPGGLVNLTTKRPQAETFYRGSLSYGSYALKDGTFDINYAPNHSAKGAFRVVGHVSDQNDATDYVYFKNYYIAPSYNFDLGDKDELSVIASYQHREFIRQQGIPYSDGAYKNYPHSLYFGATNLSNTVDSYRFGANYTHYFDHDWTFKSNFAVIKTEADNNPVLAGSNNTLPTIKRTVERQIKDDLNFTWDNNVSRHFDWGKTQYDLMIGLDMAHERSDYERRRRTLTAFNANNPVYTAIEAATATIAHQITDTQYMGLYLRNNFKIDDHWIIGLSGRHDWTQVKVDDLFNDSKLKNSDSAFTGSASLMYQMNDMFAPYLSYSTSFFPVSDTGEGGVLLDPEEGKQFEAGVKFQAFNQKLQGYLAYYDLTRKNVTESDSTLGYSVQIGEQKTKGFEAELAAALTPQWNVTATYSYIPTAETTESTTASDIGKRINHVPKNAASLSTQYFFSPDQLGWNIGAGITYQGARTAQRTTYYVPLSSYTLYDVKAGYEAKHWGANFSIKNMFDKEYLVGTTPNAQLVSWGEPRTFRLTLNFKY
ncbi:TonB-dependent siderophore receptor [Acinetobacter qingfengensis]|uniref:Ligand-gated channel protein n=1 Tax=Acinetobacter qingfengensis TaxID=1262585 RepID=A0A1E7R4R7_9GAMM|nr:TonB-dependent siderophore receptor [Acinetobacter qingfengensis]KAA8732374.1 TonB-dependent siderophore receptor [Acinetobacter qingfengensis]OEY94369.1 ligand-gated channel protein [Acinetobacter qingfengensis]